MSINNHLHSILLKVLIIFFTVACNKDNTDIVELEKLQNKRLEELFKKSDVVLLEETDSSFIGEISDLVFNEEFIVIVDQRISESCFIFKRDGSFVSKISKSVNGSPNYIVDFFDIQLNDQWIEILDVNQQAILRFDFDGNFIEKLRFGHQVKSFFPIDTNIYIFHNEQRGIEGKNGLYSIGDLEKIEEATFKQISNVRDYGWVDAFKSNAEFLKFRNQTWFTYPMSTSLFVLRDDYTAVEKITFGSQRIAGDEIKSLDMMEMGVQLAGQNLLFQKGNLNNIGRYLITEIVSGSDEQLFVVFDVESDESLLIEKSDWNLGTYNLSGPISSFNGIAVTQLQNYTEVSSDLTSFKYFKPYFENPALIFLSE